MDDKGFCLGQKRVDEKINEIKAIPELLDRLTIKGTIITTDAMGTQTAIAREIRQKKADYVLAVEANQAPLLKDIRLYSSDSELLETSVYKKTVEKAREKTEKREH